MSKSSIIKLSANKVFIIYGNGRPYAAICTISGTTIQPAVQLDTFNLANISGTALSDTMVCVAYSSGSLYVKICTIKNFINKVLTKNDKIAGIAQTNATSGQIADVIVPDYSNM